jgi:hypothetical protein
MTVGVGSPVENIGESAGWGIYQAKIDDVAGASLAGRTFNITFHVDTDSSIVFAGVAIDDVQVRFVPTVAANVEVGGRVLTKSGFGIPRAVVTMTDQSGVVRTARTNMFGYYHFDEVEVGQIYILSAFAKEYNFNSQQLTVFETLTNVNIIGEP